MKRSRYILAADAVLFMLSIVQFLRGREHAVNAAPVINGILGESLLSAPGRVEAISEEIHVSSELSGRLHSVQLEEGDRVHKGMVLRQTENRDCIERVGETEVPLAERKAELRCTVNGARSQERRAAGASVQAAKAVLENARREAERRRKLADHDLISHDEAELYERAYQVAQAEYERAVQESSLVDVDAREEDLRKAEAAVVAAEAQLAEARPYLEKTYIRSPLNGIVLRKFRHEGESVSTQFDSPIVTLPDDSSLRCVSTSTNPM